MDDRVVNNQHLHMSTPLKLSICITTFNRAAFIGATLESMIYQLTKDCEIVIVDGASQDDTEKVVAGYMSRCNGLRYIRQDRNNGIDRGYDRAVELALGEYCWLLSDDDPLKAGAVAAVLTALCQDFSLVFVNSEVRDVSLSRIIQARFYQIDSDKIYGPEEMDRLFSDMEPYLNYISGVIVKRAIWREREREQYFDSFYVFVGVIFQRRLPGNTLVIAEPLINCRVGNTHTFTPKLFELVMVKWPSVVWSLDISDAAKQSTRRDPWRNPLWLLLYSMSEYRSLVRPRACSTRQRLIPVLVAKLPGTIVNALCILVCSCCPDPHANRQIYMSLLRKSRFNMWKRIPSSKMMAR
jgi:abequosyltransferase